jgi:hypothetical protein
VRSYKLIADKVICALIVALAMTATVAAQQRDTTTKKVGRSTVLPMAEAYTDLPVAGDNTLYCAGFIQKAPVSTNTEIVGADNEKDQHVFFQGDSLYINSGSSSGVSEGDMFAVIRPRGRVHTKWTNKGNLGFYVQEVGAVEVKRVMRDVSVVEVTTSCSTLLLGDLLQPIPQRTSPMSEVRKPLDRFGAPSGKASGRIVMARDNAELLGEEMVVYIDLGSEDDVKAGDVLTVFRPLGTGNMFRKVLKESIDNKEEGYQSDRYKGGKFSNQSARKKGAEAGGAVVTSENAKSRRPSTLRRIMGELMILNVKESTATAMIIRSTSEIHPGDQVEVQ